MANINIYNTLYAILRNNGYDINQVSINLNDRMELLTISYHDKHDMYTLYREYVLSYNDLLHTNYTLNVNGKELSRNKFAIDKVGKQILVNRKTIIKECNLRK